MPSEGNPYDPKKQPSQYKLWESRERRRRAKEKAEAPPPPKEEEEEEPGFFSSFFDRDKTIDDAVEGRRRKAQSTDDAN